MTVSHEDLAARLTHIESDMARRAQQGDAHVAAFEKKLSAILASIDETKEEVVKTREVVEAFETVKNLGKFIKWASTVIAGLVALWVFVKAMAKGVFTP